MNNEVCICGNKKSFSRCCGRFLKDGKTPKTPEQLMRSRYSAFALGGYGEYLLATWFPATARGLDVPGLSERSVDWQRLDVVHKSQHGDEGTVEFNAWFRNDDGSNKIEVMHEISEFRRIEGRWYYVGRCVS